MHYHPIFLDLRGRPCGVVGGGEVATRKVEGLLRAGARITVISPQVSETIQRHVAVGTVCHLKRQYQGGDLKGFFLAYAATGVAEIDMLMARDASAHGVLLNVVDCTALCNFITPAIVQRGDLTIAISTGGKCPGFAKRVRQKIEAFIRPVYGEALAAVATQRQALIGESLPGGEARRQRFEEILESAWKELNKEVG